MQTISWCTYGDAVSERGRKILALTMGEEEEGICRAVLQEKGEERRKSSMNNVASTLTSEIAPSNFFFPFHSLSLRTPQRNDGGYKKGKENQFRPWRRKSALKKEMCFACLRGVPPSLALSSSFHSERKQFLCRGEERRALLRSDERAASFSAELYYLICRPEGGRRKWIPEIARKEKKILFRIHW